MARERFGEEDLAPMVKARELWGHFTGSGRLKQQERCQVGLGSQHAQWKRTGFRWEKEP